MSLRHIASELNMPKSTVHYHLKNNSLHLLEAKQKIKELRPKQKKARIAEVKHLLWRLVHFSPRKDYESVKAEVEKIIRQYQVLGITFKGYEKRALKKYDVCGYSHKAIHRNIGDGKEQRDPRNDARVWKNPLVIKMLNSHILPLASHIYFTNAQPNVEGTCREMLLFAETDENFYELAAIPLATLRRVIKKEFMMRGIEEQHLFLNHYNEWFKKKAYCTGAFTEDIPFGTIQMDDNKKNVYKAWVYNENTRRNELKEIKSWCAVESRTGMYLSHKLSTGEFKTEDVILLAVEALQKMGAVKLIVDQGLAANGAFKEFIANLNFAIKEILGEDAYQVEYKVAKPYHPTSKTTVEGSFGITKREFDALRNNYVGDNHKKEGRHRSNSLTPEDADYTFDDFKKDFDNYIHGKYELIPRKRNYGKEKISTRDFFNREMESFSKKEIPERAFRYALQKHKEFIYKGHLNLSIEGYQSYFVPDNFGYSALPPSFNGLRLKVLYNPNNLNEVDLYTAELIIDKLTGLYFKPGQYICTLKSVKELGTEKQKAIARHNRGRQKMIKKLAVNILPIDTMAAINKHGKLEDTPKLVQKEIAKIINEEQPLQNIAVEAKKRVEQKNHSFSIEELEKIIKEGE
jgi:predicted DNA-binding protein YlxM (UPF0122 family)